MDDEAYAKREARQNKTRKESVAAPDIYGTGQGDSEEEDGDAIEEQQPMQTGNKRRGSQVFMDEEALAKRQQRAEKKHRRMSSEAPPPLFHDNYDPEKRAKDMVQKDSPEAITKRLQRKARKVAKSAAQHVKSHRRKESLAEKLLLGPMMGDDDEDLSLSKIKDPEERKRIREKARKEQRRKSKQFIKSQVGDKGHLSDNDKDETDDKPQRHQRKVRKQMAASSRASKAVDDDLQMSSNNKKRPSIGGAPAIAKTLDEDKTLIHFQGGTWSLTSGDEAASSESDCQYEHIRLKSVHERKATPHQIATPTDRLPNDDEDSRDLSALLSQAF